MNESMTGLRELYQEVLLDHGRKPRNFRKMESASHSAEGHNPLCGDQVSMFLHIEDNTIKDIAFQGMGCVISMASASMLTTTVKGKTASEVEELFHRFHRMVTVGPQDAGPEELGKLAAFGGVVEFPVRVKCATLPWHTLQAALKRTHVKVSTE